VGLGTSWAEHHHHGANRHLGSHGELEDGEIMNSHAYHARMLETKVCVVETLKQK
jgi:hypothetical protein